MKPPILFGSFIPSCDDRKPEGVPRGTTSAFRSSKVGFPIRRSTDQSSLAAPRGLSQLTTSFIASQRQGIHQMPLRHLIALIIDAHPSAEEIHADDRSSAQIGNRRIQRKDLLLASLASQTTRGCGCRSSTRLQRLPARRRKDDRLHRLPGTNVRMVCPLHDEKQRSFPPRIEWTHGWKRKNSFGRAAPRTEAVRAEAGGARRDRTDDLLLAKQALSQLSYGPGSREASTRERKLVGLGRFELPTSRLSSARSNQLSYKP